MTEKLSPFAKQFKKDYDDRCVDLNQGETLDLSDSSKAVQIPDQPIMSNQASVIHATPQNIGNLSALDSLLQAQAKNDLERRHEQLARRPSYRKILNDLSMSAFADKTPKDEPISPGADPSSALQLPAPSLPPPTSSVALPLSQKEFYSALNQTVPAAPDDSSSINAAAAHTILSTIAASGSYTSLQLQDHLAAQQAAQAQAAAVAAAAAAANDRSVSAAANMLSIALNNRTAAAVSSGILGVGTSSTPGLDSTSSSIPSSSLLTTRPASQQPFSSPPIADIKPPIGTPWTHGTGGATSGSAPNPNHLLSIMSNSANDLSLSVSVPPTLPVGESILASAGARSASSTSSIVAHSPNSLSLGTSIPMQQSSGGSASSSSSSSSSSNSAAAAAVLAQYAAGLGGGGPGGPGASLVHNGGGGPGGMLTPGHLGPPPPQLYLSPGAGGAIQQQQQQQSTPLSTGGGPLSLSLNSQGSLDLQGSHSSLNTSFIPSPNYSPGPGGLPGGGGGDDTTKKRELRLQKNREAAKECRRKKKEYVKCLEQRVATLEQQNKTLINELRTLKEVYCSQRGPEDQQTDSSTPMAPTALPSSGGLSPLSVGVAAPPPSMAPPSTAQVPGVSLAVSPISPHHHQQQVTPT